MSNTTLDAGTKTAKNTFRGSQRSTSYYTVVAEKIQMAFNLQTKKGTSLFNRPSNGKGNKMYFCNLENTLLEKRRIAQFITGTELTSIKCGQTTANLIGRVTKSGALVVECI